MDEAKISDICVYCGHAYREFNHRFDVCLNPKCDSRTVRGMALETVHNFDFKSRTFPQQQSVTISTLLAKHGSFRRLCEAYWTAGLTADEERVLEDSTPKAEIVSYKPIWTIEIVGDDEP